MWIVLCYFQLAWTRTVSFACSGDVSPAIVFLFYWREKNNGMRQQKMVHAMVGESIILTKLFCQNCLSSFRENEGDGIVVSCIVHTVLPWAS
jgi:hypothetical protein